jgi:hypothetical protein
MWLSRATPTLRTGLATADVNTLSEVLNANPKTTEGVPLEADGGTTHGTVADLGRRRTGRQKLMTSLRETLTSEALSYVRDQFEDELVRICPEEWEPDRIRKLVEIQLDHSRYILDAIGIDELHNVGALQRHVGQSILELRSRVHQEVAADRRMETR